MRRAFLIAAAGIGSAAIVLACAGYEDSGGSGDASTTDAGSGFDVTNDLGDGGSQGRSDARSDLDGSAPPACDLSAPFGPLTPFDPVNTDANDEGQLRFSPDGELAYYTRGSFVSAANSDIWVATRRAASGTVCRSRV